MKQTQKYTQKLTRSPNQFFSDYQEKLVPEKVKQFLLDILEQCEKAASLGDWEQAILHWNEVKAHLGTHYHLVELAFHCHTKDPEIEKEEQRFKQELEPIIEEWNAKIREKILASKHLSDLKEKFSNQYFITLQLEQDAFDPKNIALEKELNKILSQYTKLMGEAGFEWEGKKLPIAQYKKFSSSPDTKVRHQSFLNYTSWYLKNRNALESIYDEAVELRQKMARVLGFENFIPLGYQKMRRTDYGPEEVADLREQIHQVMVPLAQQIRKKQAEALGDERVKIWNSDFFPQWQNGELKVPVSEQTQTCLKVYEKISPKLAKHFKAMLNAGLIDVEAREGKAPGAFCTDFPDYRVPFMFLNSVNEASDVTTMLHESGHSFQAWESRNIDLIELRWPTMESCEVHSMSMEFLAYPYFEEFFTNEDATKYKQKHLAESIFILPYIAMVDEFQHLVYSGQAQGPEGRAQAWESLEKKYAPDVDYSDCPEWQRHRWIRQLHIFQAPFYYIDYAIAQVGAWQIWVQSVKDKNAAIENYLKLCRLGGTLPLKDFFKAGNLKLPFEDGMLAGLMEKVMAIEPLQ